MARAHTAAALITTERAAEDAWITYQSRVNRLSAPRIAELALLAAVRLADGSFDVNAGLGKHMAERTIRFRLSERREAIVEEMIRRPLADMIAEQLEALEEEEAWWAMMSRPIVHIADPDSGRLMPAPNSPKDRQSARANLLRVMESKRKLLGLDQPTKVEVQGTVIHDDPASVALKAALEDAARRRDQLLEDIRAEAET